MKKYQGKYSKPKRPFRPLFWIGVCCLILALDGAVYLGLFLLNGARTNRENRKTAQSYVQPAKTQPATVENPVASKETEPAEMEETLQVSETQEETQPDTYAQIDFPGLREKNEDVVAWLQVPALELMDYPVVIGEDNAYYAAHSWDNQESKAGAIFLDFRNNRDFSQVHNILYGHCMKDGTMFQSLGKWESARFFEDSDRQLLLYLPEEVRVYEIFAVERINALDARVYTTDYTPGEEWKNAIAQTLEHSQHRASPEYGEDSEILTLSTCMGDTDRLAVHAICVQHFSRA